VTTKHSAQDFAILGGPRLFKEPVHVGQLHFPSWERYEAAMRGIFERQYYTNHGVLAKQFEARLAEFFQVKHAIVVTNGTLGLIMAVKALGLAGKVILPSFTFIASAQSLTWAGVEPVFCDVDPATSVMSLRHVRELLERETGIDAILGVNLFGGSCDPKALEGIAAEYGVELYFDSAHAFGCTIDGAPIGRFGRLEVFSFHATKVFSTTEGGCVTTNDDALAARLRNIRSSYGAGPPAQVPFTSNGRFSEAQAAIGLLNLETFGDALANNRASYALYRERLAGIPGIAMLHAHGVEQTNCQYLVCRIDEQTFGMSRNELLAVLKAENVNARRYFYPGIHRTVPYVNDFPQYVDALPETDRISASLMQLPIGALVPLEKIEAICDLIADAQRHAAPISHAMKVSL
jgi:dTDP-4-amino-4,6-dideoxygalactose transaminase